MSYYYLSLSEESKQIMMQEVPDGKQPFTADAKDLESINVHIFGAFSLFCLRSCFWRS